MRGDGLVAEEDSARSAEAGVHENGAPEGGVDAPEDGREREEIDNLPPHQKSTCLHVIGHT